MLRKFPHALKRGHSPFGGHRSHSDKVPFEEYEVLAEQCESLRQDVEDVEENLQLAKVSSRTLHDICRAEKAEQVQLQTSLGASEALVSELESSAHGAALEATAALNASEARASETESQRKSTDDRHRQIVAKLANEATAKAAGADDARTKLSQTEKLLEELRAEATESSAATSQLDVARAAASELRSRLEATEAEVRQLRDKAQQSEAQCGELTEALTEAKDAAAVSILEAKAAESATLEALRAELESAKRASGENDEQQRSLALAVHQPTAPDSVAASIGEAEAAASAVSAVAELLRTELDSAEKTSASLRTQLDSAVQASKEHEEDRSSSALAVHQQEAAQDSAAEMVANMARRHSSSSIEGAAGAAGAAAEMHQLQETLERHEATISSLESRLECAETTAAEGIVAKIPVSDPLVFPVEGESHKLLVTELEEEVRELEAKIGQQSDASFKLMDENTTLEELLQESKETLEALGREAVEENARTEGLGFEAGKTAEQLERLEERCEHSESRLESTEQLLADLRETREELAKHALPNDCENEQLARATSEATERSEAAEQRSLSLLVELLDSQMDSDHLREELVEAKELANELATERAEAAAAAGHATALAAERLADLADSQVEVDALRAEAEKVTDAEQDALRSMREAWAATEALREEHGEALQATEKAEAITGAAHREEMSMAEELAHAISEHEELKEELAREGAGHSAAATAADGALAEHTALRAEVAAAEAAAEDGDALARELREELAAEAALVPRLQAELAQRSAAAAAARPTDSEAQELEDLRLEVKIYSETCMDDEGADPPGLREALRLRSECAQLEAELHRSAANANLRRSSNSSAADEADRLPRHTADFGSASPSKLRVAGLNEFGAGSGRFDSDRQRSDDSEGAHRVRSSPSFASFPGPISQSSANPFEEDDANPFEEDIHDGQPPSHFAPPPRVTSSEVEGNPFEQGDSPNPFSHTSSPGSNRNPLGATPEDEPLGVGLPCPSCSSEASELMHLREALQSEHRACAEANAAAASARSAAEAASGAASDDVARRLEVALAEEVAKSRRLGEYALRAEESRRRLYQEMLSDSEVGTPDADLLQLARVVGRAAKAIGAVSAAAPRLSSAAKSATTLAAPRAPEAPGRPSPVRSLPVLPEEVASPSPTRSPAVLQDETNFPRSGLRLAAIPAMPHAAPFASSSQAAPGAVVGSASLM